MQRIKKIFILQVQTTINIKNIMKTKILSLSLYVGVFGVLSYFCCGCRSEISGSTEQTQKSQKYVQITNSLNVEIPLATEEELEKVTGFEMYEKYGFLDYRIARDCAFAEFYANVENYYPEQVIKELGLPNLSEHKEELSFADKPVIVYDYKDKPYYYEFSILFKKEYIVGTVTISAQPSTKELIEYLFPFPIQYSEFSFKYHRYIGEYPLVYYGLGNSQYYQADLIVDGEHEFDKLIPVENSLLISNRYPLIMEKVARTLSTEEKEQIEKDLYESADLKDAENNYQTLFEYAKSFETSDDIVKYWLDLTYQNSQNTEEQFQITPEMEQLIDKNIHDISAKYIGFLPEYEDHNLRLTHWRDFCGPAALSWIYRGKYSKFNDTYISIFGDNSHNSFVNNVSYAYYYLGNNNTTYPNTYETREKRSFDTDGGLYYTFFKETIKTGEQFPLYDGGIRRGVENATNGEYKIRFITTPIAWMRDKKQPVLVEGIRGNAHYWTAVGYAYNKSWIGIKTNMRIFVADNGYRMGEHNYYPYWSILGGLNYAWVYNK